MRTRRSHPIKTRAGARFYLSFSSFQSERATEIIIATTAGISLSLELCTGECACAAVTRSLFLPLSLLSRFFRVKLDEGEGEKRARDRETLSEFARYKLFSSFPR